MMTEGGGSSVTEALTTLEPGQDIDAGLVVNGSINVRKTHPTLYRLVMSTAVVFAALGVNFLVFKPTFFVWDMPNEVWAAFFLAISVGMIVFLNFYRSLRLTRATMAFAVAYLSFFAVGTMQPALEGKGSLQLPILYIGMVALLVPMVLEPFINPWTARRD